MKKGTRVTVTGHGRTARWGAYTGIVVRSTKRYITVRWDGTHFEDEMTRDEIREVTP